MRSRHPRPDANQKQIKRELEQIPGLRFRAWNISRFSDEECPGDLLVLDQMTGRWQPFEIKIATGRISAEQLVMSRFVPIVRTTEDILKWFGRLC